MTKTLDLDPDPDPGEGEEGVGSRGKAGMGGAGVTCTSAENQAGLGSVASQFDPVLPSDPPSPDSPMETFAAPAEVRHFTDGSFPAGFALQLFSHTQLRASNRRDLPKEGKGAQGDRLQPESPSPGERLSRGGGRCAGLGRPRPQGGAPGRGDWRSGPRAAGLRAGGFKYSSQPES